MSSVAGKIVLVVGAAGVVGGGLWLALHLVGEEAHGEAPAASSSALVTKDNAVVPKAQRPALPEPVVEDEPPAAPVAATTAKPLHAPAAAVAELPVLSPAALWDDFYRTLDGSIAGTVTGEDALRLAAESIGRLPGAGPPEVNAAGTKATWTLLDDPAQGKVTLVHRRDHKPGIAEFMVSASLVTRPGAYTKYAEDGASTTEVDIDLGMTGGDVPGIIRVMTQVGIKPGPKLMHAAPEDQPMPIGGELSVGADGSRWTALVALHERDAGGRESIVHRELETRSVKGSLADPRVAAIGQRLAALRTH